MANKLLPPDLYYAKEFLQAIKSFYPTPEKTMENSKPARIQQPDGYGDASESMHCDTPDKELVQCEYCGQTVVHKPGCPGIDDQVKQIIEDVHLKPSAGCDESGRAIQSRYNRELTQAVEHLADLDYAPVDRAAVPSVSTIRRAPDGRPDLKISEVADSEHRGHLIITDASQEHQLIFRESAERLHASPVKSLYPGNITAARYYLVIVNKPDCKELGSIEFDIAAGKVKFNGDLDESAKQFARFVHAHLQSLQDGDRDGIKFSEAGDPDKWDPEPEPAIKPLTFNSIPPHKLPPHGSKI